MQKTISNIESMKGKKKILIILNIISLIFTCSIFFIPVSVNADSTFQQINVVDDAGVIGDYTQINEEINNFKANCNIDIFVHVVDSLNGISIEEYTDHEFETKVNNDINSALIVIAIQDRKFRIQAGEMAKNLLTPELRNYMIDKAKMHFKDNNYKDGIISAIQSVNSRIGEHDISPVNATNYSEKNTIWGIIIGLFIFVFIVYVITHIITYTINLAEKSNKDDCNKKSSFNECNRNLDNYRSNRRPSYINKDTCGYGSSSYDYNSYSSSYDCGGSSGSYSGDCGGSTGDW